jgi:hypothetical protein
MSKVIPGALFDPPIDSLRREELLAPPLPDNKEEVVSDIIGACEEYAIHFQALLAGKAAEKDPA